jgi:hypothetical protein
MGFGFGFGFGGGGTSNSAAYSSCSMAARAGDDLGAGALGALATRLRLGGAGRRGRGIAWGVVGGAEAADGADVDGSMGSDLDLGLSDGDFEPDTRSVPFLPEGQSSPHGHYDAEHHYFVQEGDDEDGRDDAADIGDYGGIGDFGDELDGDDPSRAPDGEDAQGTESWLAPHHSQLHPHHHAAAAVIERFASPATAADDEPDERVTPVRVICCLTSRVHPRGAIVDRRDIVFLFLFPVGPGCGVGRGAGRTAAHRTSRMAAVGGVASAACTPPRAEQSPTPIDIGFLRQDIRRRH